MKKLFTLLTICFLIQPVYSQEEPDLGAWYMYFGSFGTNGLPIFKDLTSIQQLSSAFFQKIKCGGIF